MKPCNQCGKCCIEYGNGGLGSATLHEINQWEAEAPEVLEYVDDFLGDLWLSSRPVPLYRNTLTQWNNSFIVRLAARCYYVIFYYSL